MLDLKKLKALELPKKEIEIEILGDTQKVEVQALDDEVSLRLATITDDSKLLNTERELAIRREILKNGIVGISDDDITLLMKRAAVSMIPVLTTIRDLTVEYNELRAKTGENAKKKSIPAALRKGKD